MSSRIDENEFDKCALCNMLVSPGEYHPYTACVLYRQLGQADKVKSCLDSVIEYATHSRLKDGGAERLYAPSSAREVNRLLDAIEQSIRGLAQPLGPYETATRVALAAEYGLSYVAALRERLAADFAAAPTETSEQMVQKCVDCAAPDSELWMCSDGAIRCGGHKFQFAVQRRSETSARCGECGAENGWHRTACLHHPRFTVPRGSTDG